MLDLSVGPQKLIIVKMARFSIIFCTLVIIKIILPRIVLGSMIRVSYPPKK